MIKETSRFSKDLPVYEPKHFNHNEKEDGSLSFRRIENIKNARIALSFLLIAAGDRIKSGSIIDNISQSEIGHYYVQGLQNYFDDEWSDHYRNGYYDEGRDLLMQYRQRKKKPLEWILQKSNEDICKLLAADFHLKTAWQNARRGLFRCQNTSVPFLGIDAQTKEFTYTSNHTRKLLGTCTLQNSSEKSDRKFSAANNAEVCLKSCGKEPDGCAERNFLKKAEGNKLINPQRVIGYFDYDSDHYASCKSCDAALGIAGLPIYVALAQPNTVFVNQDAPLYKQTIGEILDIVGSKSDILNY